jgi:hypothetical protein
MDLTKDFYFSYTYDLTHTLQYNLCNNNAGGNGDYNSKFVWNHFLLGSLYKKLPRHQHGFYQLSMGSTVNQVLSRILLNLVTQHRVFCI